MIICQYIDVILRDFKESDIPKKIEWINNPENNRFLHYNLPLNIIQTTEWFKNKDNTKRLDCIIEYESVPVGLIGLLHIDYANMKAEYYITIGEKDYKQKGIATKATKAILKYAFEELGLREVYLTVDAKNKRAIQLYEKVGFKKEKHFANNLFCIKNSELADREKKEVMNKQSCLHYVICSRQQTIFNKEAISITPVVEMGSYQGNQLWIKREDLIPFSFGGNKARKARLFFRDIDLGNYDCVVTYGSGSSNHCRVVANECCRRGLECHIISPEETAETSFNSQMMKLFGAEITAVPVNEVHNTIEKKIEELINLGKHPYFIEGGGHGNIGTEAYVQCYQEIKEQEEKTGIHFDYIFFASGTGTTHAGLVCGQLLDHDKRKIVGISIARKNPRGRDVVLDSIRLYLGNRVVENEIQDKTFFVDEYTNGYGKDDKRVLVTLAMVLKNYGIPLDATYTGKAFMGMSEYLKKEKIKNKNILFIHTGGMPLFFDALRRLENEN